MTLNARYYHSEIKGEVLSLKCDACQCHKFPGKYYGSLPEKGIKEQLFEKVVVD